MLRIMKTWGGNRKVEYEFRSSYWTFEKYLEKVTDPSLIVMDGSNGAAAYLSPDWGSAHALMAVKGLETGDNLEITITMKDYRNIETADRVAQLSKMIQEEVSRIQAEASVIRSERFWTDGIYRGIRFFPMDHPEIIVTMDLPEMTFHTTGNGEISGKMFVTGFTNSGFDCYMVKEPGNSVSLEFTVSTWSVFESDPEETVSYTLRDGAVWGICVERDIEGKPRQAYGSCVLSQDDTRTIYLTVRISTSSNDTYWPDIETFTGDLETVMKSIFVSGGTGGNYSEQRNAAQPLTGWQKIDGKWYRYSADGMMAIGWQRIDGNWYWFGSDGAMVTGWQKLNNGGKEAWSYFKQGDDGSMVTGLQEIDGKKYYFDDDGRMLTGWQKLEDGETTAWKYFIPGDNGSMVTGWQKIDGKWYWFDSDGTMTTGWKKLDNDGTAAWSYFMPGDNGSMVTGWQEIDGKKYYFDDNGRMLTGWQKLDNDGTAAWSYFMPGDSGSMVSGWQEIDGKKYYFDDNGRMLTGWQKLDNDGMAAWSYFIPGDNGSMVTGLREIDGKKYYFNENGRMLTGWQKPDSSAWSYFKPGDDGSMAIGWQEVKGQQYWFDSDGRMATGWQEIDGAWYYFHGSGEMNTLIPAIASESAAEGNGEGHYYTYAADTSKSMGFNRTHAADPLGAAFYTIIQMTDYSIARDEKADAGMLFEDNLLVNPSFVGNDGSYINLMILSEETNQAFLVFYDTLTGNAFSFYEDGIEPQKAESDFAALCPDGYLAVTTDAVLEVYTYILGTEEDE